MYIMYGVHPHPLIGSKDATDRFCPWFTLKIRNGLVQRHIIVYSYDRLMSVVQVSSNA